MHMNKYTSPDEVPGEKQISLDTEVTVGSFVVVLDSSGDIHYKVAEMIDITDTNEIHETTKRTDLEQVGIPLRSSPIHNGP